jgi:hypothetical protein
MNVPNITNSGLLKAVASDPEGYVTKDGMWAAVPFTLQKHSKENLFQVWRPFYRLMLRFQHKLTKY